MSTNPVVDLVPTVGHWIGGSASPAATRTADVFNPASGRLSPAWRSPRAPMSMRPCGGGRGFPGLGGNAGAAPGAHPVALQGTVEEHADELARLLSREHGKTSAMRAAK